MNSNIELSDIKVVLYKSINEFINASEKTWSFYQDVMKIISKRLNEYNEVNYSERYWNILVGKWIWPYIMILFNKYCYFDRQLCKGKFDIQNKNFSTGYDLRMFQIEKTCSDIMNGQIGYLLFNYNLDKNYFIDAIKNEKKYDMKILDKKKNINDGIVIVTDKLKYLFTEKDWYILRKILEKNNVVILNEIKKEKNNVFDLMKRKKFFEEKNLNMTEFEYLFWNSLCYNLPNIYLENYKDNMLEMLHLYEDKSADRIYETDILDNSSFIRDFYIAYQVEKYKTKLIILQHGGNYGMDRFNYAEVFERYISDSFVSWGWTGEKVIPMYNLLLTKLSKKDVKKNNKKDRVLYLTTMEFKYTIFFAGMINFVNYRNNIKKFLSSMLKDYNMKIEWRSYSQRLAQVGKEEDDDVLAYLSKGEINGTLITDNKGDFYQKLKRCKIFVTDYCGTTFVESIGYNIPTVIFWDKKVTQLNNITENMVEKMEKVGIFHSNPESAAAFVKKIYNNVDEWWESEDVKGVKDEFCVEFSRKNENIIMTYSKFFVTGIREKSVNKLIVSYNRFRDLKYMFMCVKIFLRNCYSNLKIMIRGILNEFI